MRLEKNFRGNTIEIHLEGLENLCETREYTVMKDGVNKKEKNVIKYPLRRVTRRELFELRATGEPGFVFKVSNEEYYYARIHKKMRFYSQMTLGTHLCACYGSGCRRLSAALDIEGGCAKVREASTELYMREGKDFLTALSWSSRIEKYDFIQKGYESFNTDQNSLVVIKCRHFEEDEKKEPSYNVSNVDDVKLSLAQYLWPETENWSGVKEHMKANNV